MYFMGLQAFQCPHQCITLDLDVNSFSAGPTLDVYKCQILIYIVDPRTEE